MLIEVAIVTVVGKHCYTLVKVKVIIGCVLKWDVSVANSELPNQKQNWCTHGKYIFYVLNM